MSDSPAKGNQISLLTRIAAANPAHFSRMLALRRVRIRRRRGFMYADRKQGLVRRAETRLSLRMPICRKVLGEYPAPMEKHSAWGTP